MQSMFSFCIVTGYSTVTEIPAGATDIALTEQGGNKNSLGMLYGS